MEAGSHTIRWRGMHHVGRPIGIFSYLADPPKVRGKDAELVFFGAQVGSNDMTPWAVADGMSRPAETPA